MDKCRYRPDTKTWYKNDRQWELFPEAEVSHEIEKNAWQNPPKSAFCEFLHNVRITFVFQIHPDKDKGACKGHDTNEPGRRGELLPNCRGAKNYDHTDNDFNQDLHCILPVQWRQLPIFW